MKLGGCGGWSEHILNISAHITFQAESARAELHVPWSDLPFHGARKLSSRGLSTVKEAALDEARFTSAKTRGLLRLGSCQTMGVSRGVDSQWTRAFSYRQNPKVSSTNIVAQPLERRKRDKGNSIGSEQRGTCKVR